MRYKVMRLYSYLVGYFDCVKQYYYNLINWKRSDHILITFNFA